MATKTKPSAKIIRHQELLQCGIHLFEMDGSKPGVKWVQEVDTQSLACECSCPDFSIRHAKHDPKVYDGNHLCKHLQSAVEWLLDNSYLNSEDLELAALLDTLNPCCQCNMADAEMLVCDADGRETGERLCAVCFQQKRAENEQWSNGALCLQSEIERLTIMRDAVLAEGKGLESTTYEVAQLQEQIDALWHKYMACEPKGVES